jgi:hypothetical protein
MAKTKAEAEQEMKRLRANGFIQSPRDQFQLSNGNLEVLRLVPDMMNDPYFRQKLRKLAIEFKFKSKQ